MKDGLRARIEKELVFFREIRAARFDMTVDLTSGDRPAWISWFSGARHRLAYHPDGKGFWGKRWLYNHMAPPCRDPDLHEVLKNLGVLAHAGIPSKDPHMEVFPSASDDAAVTVALRAAGARAKGAELYVTLEPCNHLGRTPPCAPAIAAAGIRRVFVGSADPNPLVQGRGVRWLRRQGIAVETGLFRAPCDAINEPWLHFIRTKRPFVTMKAAISLDGRLAPPPGHGRWVSSDEAREEVHLLRDAVDAVLVGRGTVATDDPRLTARTEGGRDPLRIVLDGQLRSSPRAKLAGSGTLFVAGPRPPVDAQRALEATGAEVLRLPREAHGASLPMLLSALAARGIVHLLVEGGTQIFSSFLAEGLVDRLLVHQAPRVFGSGPLFAAFAPPATLPAFVLRAQHVAGETLVLDLRPAPVRPGAARRQRL